MDAGPPDQTPRQMSEIFGELLYSFLDDSESFAYGFHCGMIHQMMMDGTDIDRMVQIQCKEQLIIMAERLGYDYSIDPINEQWFNFRASLNIQKKISL